MDITIIIGTILVNNFVLDRFLGVCPFTSASKKVETALGMGLAITFVMGAASILTFVVYNAVLVNLGIQYLYNVAFIMVIACMVQLTELFMKKASPALYQALGMLLPLITTNCAVLGVVIINMEEGFGFMAAFANGISAAIGFTIAIVLFAGIRERLEYNDILPSFLGFPIALITSGLMSLAFFGFRNIV